MNSIENRHIGNNIRILLIKIKGEIRNFDNTTIWQQLLEMMRANIMTAAGYYANKSPLQIKHYAEDLEVFIQGFWHICNFASPKSSKPILFEVFTNNVDKSNTLKMIWTCASSTEGKLRKAANQIIPAAVKILIKGFIKNKDQGLIFAISH